TATALGQRLHPMAGVGAPPATDGFAGDAEDLGNLDLGQAQLAATQGPQAECFEDIIGQVPGVGQYNRHDDYLRLAKGRGLMPLVHNFRAEVISLHEIFPDLYGPILFARDQVAALGAGAERHCLEWHGEGFTPGLDVEVIPAAPRVPDLDGF